MISMRKWKQMRLEKALEDARVSLRKLINVKSLVEASNDCEEFVLVDGIGPALMAIHTIVGNLRDAVQECGEDVSN